MKRRYSISLLAAAALALSGAAGFAEETPPAETDANAPTAETVETAEDAAAETVGAAGDVAEDAAEATDDAAASEGEPAASEEAADAAPAAGSDKISDEARAEYAALEGSAEAGARVFRQCMACHVVEAGVNRVGPSLNAIVGRDAGSVEGFRYSPANANSGVVWSEEALFVYLQAPREFIPGTTMAFVGIKDAQQRADLIAYLKAQSE